MPAIETKVAHVVYSGREPVISFNKGFTACLPLAVLADGPCWVDVRVFRTCGKVLYDRGRFMVSREGICKHLSGLDQVYTEAIRQTLSRDIYAIDFQDRDRIEFDVPPGLHARLAAYKKTGLAKWVFPPNERPQHSFDNGSSASH